MRSHILEINNSLNECPRIVSYLESYFQVNNLSSSIHDDFRLALEEAFVNIISYGYKNNSESTITIELERTDTTVILHLKDNGVAFNPLAETDDLEKNNDYSQGGMGITLIKSLTDEQHYQRNKNMNILSLVKYL